MKSRVLFLYLLTMKLIFGYINVYPSFFYEKLDKNGIFKTFTLTNKKDENIKYRLYLEDKKSNDISIEIYPKSITLKPFEKKEFRVLIKKKNDKILNQEFSEKLVIKEVELPSQKKKVLTMLKLKLSGYEGDLTPKLEYTKLNNNSIRIKNIGSRAGIYEIFNSKNEFIDLLILKKNESKELKINLNETVFKEKFMEKTK